MLKAILLSARPQFSSPQAAFEFHAILDYHRGMKAAAIVFLSPRQAFAALQPQLAEYHSISLKSTQRFIKVLIDEGAALLFLDGAQANWRELALAAKNNAATRRIPICLVSDDDASRADALLHGADMARSWRELEAELPRIVKQLARRPDAAEVARLACQCADELPPLARQGLELFNRGEYYRQHDLFEAQWMASEGPIRDLYRAILQVGVAYYQLERGNYRGALKMLQRSVQWLHWLPDSCQGVDVAQLRRDSYALRGELNRLGSGGLAELDRGLIKPVRWRPPQSPST